MKKFFTILCLGLLLILSTKTSFAATKVPIVKPRSAIIDWFTGDGNPIDLQGYRVKTPSAEKGTLVFEIKRNQFPGGGWDGYRPHNSGGPPIHLYNSPFNFGNDRTKWSYSSPGSGNIMKVNPNSKDGFTLYGFIYIDHPSKDKTYYLNLANVRYSDAFFIKPSFYANVNLRDLPDELRAQYVLKGNLDHPSYKTQIGRIIVIYDDTYLYSPEGKIVRKLKAGESLRVYKDYGSMFNYSIYDVGNGYYINTFFNSKLILGNIYSKSEEMIMFSKEGKVFKKYKPKQTIRAYKLIGDKYDVGGGYYVKKTKDIVLEK